MNNDEQENVEFLKAIWNALEDETSQYNEDDYEVDQEQMDKFTDAYSIMLRIANANDGEISPIKFSTLTRNGEIAVHCTLLDLMGIDKLDFCKVVALSSVTSFETTPDNRVCITIVIPRVLKLKSDS